MNWPELARAALAANDADAIAQCEAHYGRPAAELRVEMRFTPEPLPPTAEKNGNGQHEAPPPSAPDEYTRMTDVGNARRFVNQHAGTVRFDCGQHQWMIWDGTRWAVDMVGRAVELAKKTARSIFDEAKAAAGNPNSGDPKALATWAIKSESRDRLAAMLKLAESDPDMATPTDAWDADRMVLNAANGTINLRTGAVQPHDPDDLITRLAPVAYHPEAQSPIWDAFLNRVFAGHPDVAAWLQAWHGHCLTGDISVQVMPVYYGEGNNGKSTMLDAIMAVMGDYAAPAPPDLLMEKYGDQHPTELAALRGRRLVVASENEKRRKLKIALVKRLTGDASITARGMRQDFFTFARTSKMVLMTNNKPRVDEDTVAAWRRIRLIPFSVIIADADVDPAMPAKLLAESPGILRWLVEGAALWSSTGKLPPTTEVADATAQYRAESDPLAEFIAECCILAPNSWVSNDTLRSNYERYCKGTGDHPIKGREFTDGLKKRSCESKVKYGSGRGWSGICVVNPVESSELLPGA